MAQDNGVHFVSYSGGSRISQRGGGGGGVGWAFNWQFWGLKHVMSRKKYGTLDFS